MKFKKMTFKEAVAEVRKFRPNVLPNLGFERQLKRYEEQIKGKPIISRDSKRSEAKINETGQSQLLMQTQLMPNFGALIIQNPKEKLSGQIREKLN